ncbi:hypothetical protein SAMD00019534_111240 [Acytostelium subglobosum LB1]|uniref:hypothetical protein n=1 Tax=Acytostelium subglobosum LB1 TaxID=1410327 RepID=UPI000644E544|nr:hypothetical protein SAMD00019534_111240 [Acytostelium subglobosum LB1]GAM27948.1 hypothetical protein SAMD00019534_111240 [Acytostelium subglobosum LB1]|eukprot:XP_012749231.1 hypothetical protein SAMD00019534_111240 [Acytostelium subglobosum LB1]
MDHSNNQQDGNDDDIPVPESWDDDDDATQLYLQQQIDRRMASLSIQQQQNNNAKQSTTTTITTTNIQTPASQQEPEEPLILINFTKFTDGHVVWNKVENKLDGGRLFKMLVQKIKESQQSFEIVTDDLWQRGLAFHSTTRTWTDDIRTLERLHSGDFFSMIAYPVVAGGFLVSEMWRKVKERTEWRSVNFLKCIYLAKCNRSLMYKHRMALALEFMAIEQKVLGRTAQRMLDEEALEHEAQVKAYERALFQRHEKEITKRIITSLQKSIGSNEGINLNDDRVFNPQQHWLDQDNDNEEEEEYDNDDNENYDQEEGDYDGEEGDYDGDDEQAAPQEQDKDVNVDVDKDKDVDKDDEAEDDQDQDDEYLDEADNEDDGPSIKVTHSALKYKDDNDNEEDEDNDNDNEKDNEIDKTPLEPPKAIMNVLDQVMAMIFSSLTIVDDEQTHFRTLDRLQQSVRDNWKEEFGCLPPTCIWRDDMS